MKDAKKKYLFQPFETEISRENSVWLESLILDKSGLKICLDSETSHYIFTFKNTCPFRRTDEGDWVNQGQDYEFLNPNKLTCTFVGDSSDFIDTLCKYSQWGNDPSSYGRHYLFATDDDVLDVISRIFPTVTVEKK